MDVRTHNDSNVIFADEDGGTAKATSLEKVVPSQFRIRARGKTYVYIERKDLASFKKALAYAEEMWK